MVVDRRNGLQIINDIVKEKLGHLPESKLRWVAVGLYNEIRSRYSPQAFQEFVSGKPNLTNLKKHLILGEDGKIHLDSEFKV